VGWACEQYELYMRDLGNRPRSIETTVGRLRCMLGAKTKLNRLSTKYLQDCYNRRRRKVSVDTSRNELAECKTFMKWAVHQAYISKGSVKELEEIQGVGRRSEGKEQLRISEARAYISAALTLSTEQAAGALCPLLLGLRASEVIERIGRDVDDDGRVLWVPRGKTKNARRALYVPEPLRSMLLKLAIKAGKYGHIFPGRGDTAHRTRTWLRKLVARVCKKALVPRVCPHGLRGTHSTLAIELGETSLAVARSLGHGSPRVTERYYVDKRAQQRAKQDRFLTAIAGGRS